jgi:hypothetical protein
MKEGTIVGFKIMIDSEGMLVTEHIELPDHHIAKVFKEEESQVLIRAAIRAFKEITGDIHAKLETELDAINRVCQ